MTALPHFLRLSELAALLRLDCRTLRRYVVEGRLPPPLRFTSRTLRWPRRDVLQLLDHGPFPPGWFLTRRFPRA